MILVDAHVHIYDCFDLRIFFNSALANFKSEASRHGKGDAFNGILLLTESTTYNWFQYLAGCAMQGKNIQNTQVEPWSLHFTSETCSLWAESYLGEGLHIIAGRQITTLEHLEVLALLTPKQFADFQPLRQVIQAVKAAGAVPVVPWGFGKWTGTRGKILAEKMANSSNCNFFLGDNSGRASFLPYPALFKMAEKKAIRILPGSDPLPFASESGRVGRFGFLLDVDMNPDRPAQSIKSILMDSDQAVRPYGQLETPFCFVRNQLIMQLRKRLRPRRVDKQ